MNVNPKIHELSEAMRTTKNRRLYERYQAVKLVLEGFQIKKVARMTNRDPQTIGNYVKSYKKGGIEALHPKKQSGRPKRLTKAQEEELREIIAFKIPEEVGFPARANWTLSASQLIKRKWGFTYSLKGTANILHRLGLSCTRPTYTLKKADLEKQETFKNETFPKLKKLLNGDIDYVLFEDESMIRDYQAIGNT